MLANVLVAQAAGTLAAGSERLPAAGPSFRDAVRVAGAPSAIWTDIYVSNRDALLDEIDGVLGRLAAVRAALDGRRRRRRHRLERRGRRGPPPPARGPAGRGRGVRAPGLGSQPPGVVAQLALELGRAGVNIADMALYPASDMSEGVIALWIAGADAADRAHELVVGLGFPVARP